MTSLTTSSWQLSKFKQRSKCRIRRLSCCIYLENRLSYNHQNLEAHFADLPYIYTGYDITNYFRSGATAKNSRKCRLKRLQVEFLENSFSRGSPNLTRLSGINDPTKLPDMTSSQHAIEYWTKVMRKTGPAGQRVK